MITGSEFGEKRGQRKLASMSTYYFLVTLPGPEIVEVNKTNFTFTEAPSAWLANGTDLPVKVVIALQGG